MYYMRNFSQILETKELKCYITKYGRSINFMIDRPKWWKIWKFPKTEKRPLIVTSLGLGLYEVKVYQRGDRKLASREEQQNLGCDE